MSVYDTPRPISVILELGVGNIRIVASDRSDTVVSVQPSDPDSSSDVAAARQTQVEFANDSLLIKAPRGWRHWTPWGGHESIDVDIELPTGSSMRGEAGVAGLRCIGKLGDLTYRIGVGDVFVDSTDALEVKAGAGDVNADLVRGRADVKTCGGVRIGKVEGAAVIKNSNGDTWIGEVAGEARVNAANGSISVGSAGAGIVAKTANGSVRLDEAARGPVVAQSALGAIEVGVPDGVPAWLQLETKFGRVRNDLDDAERPGPDEDPIEVHAQTSMGDISIHRAPAGDAG
jgi:hypothetical protein